MKNTVLLAAVATAGLIVVATSDTHAANQSLFTPMKSSAVSTDQAYRSLVNDRATLSTILVHADASQISEKSEVLLLGDSGAAYMQYSYRNPDGTTIWYGNFGKRFGVVEKLREKMTGEIADDPLNSVMIVRNGNKLAGTIRINGALYNLQSLTSGGHVIARVDESKLPDESHPVLADSLDAAIASNSKKTVAARATATALSTVRVMIVYTAAAAAAAGDTKAKSNLAIAESNQGFVNSNVSMRFELAGSYIASNYTYDGDLNADRVRLASGNDGYMDNFHPKRNEIAADISMLIAKPTSGCGVAPMRVSESNAYAAVSLSCMTGNYTFAHEIGHLVGTSHDKDVSPNPFFDYGHGYYSVSGGWRTVMSYGATGCACPRINFWSNPNKTYNGRVMGTAAVANNARLLNERAAIVAAFR